MNKKTRRHPDWLKVPIPGGKSYVTIKKRLRNAKLHTICEEAKCPNLAECFERGTATFLILGDTCSRNCKYCKVNHGKPGPLEPDEPIEVAESIQSLNLSYAVITSVTRDDLSDGGASIFSKTIKEVRKMNPSCKIEVLIPDFNGNQKALQMVLDAKPDVLNHNIEVVKELFPTVRPEGDYQRSIDLLKQCKQYDSKIPTKSGFMVGLGETTQQIKKLLEDLSDAQVDMITIGQYLQPSKQHIPVTKYYTPEEFEQFKKQAIQLGFSHVESGPLVRSSYHAENAVQHM